MRLFSVFHRARREREFAEELASHLAFHIEDNLRAGMSPEEARRQALIKLGGVTLAKELRREQGGLPMLETFWQDIRFGLRMLRKNPGFSLIAILTLALGIGANTAIFSLVHTLLLRPLPYHESARLVLLSDKGRTGGRNFIPYPNFSDWRERAQSFEGMAAVRGQLFNLTGTDRPAQLRGRMVNWNFFHLLGVQPQLGRLFVAEDDRYGAARTALLIHGMWQEKFGGAAGIVGKKLLLEGEPYEVIGVLPRGFEYFRADDVYMPLGLALGVKTGYYAGLLDRKVTYGLNVLARLKPGVTLQQADQEMASISAQLEREYPDANNGRRAQAEALQDVMSEGVRQSLWVLLAAVGFILLIACVNVANLLLVRAACAAIAQ